MNRHVLAWSTLAIAASFCLLPAAQAHWATTPGAATHDHYVAKGNGYTAGYFGQRTCQPGPVWSNPDGTCPGGTTPFVPPLRGLTGTLPGAFLADFTVPGTGAYAATAYTKNNPHVGTVPVDVLVDHGDVDDYFLSSTTDSDCVGASGGPLFDDPGALPHYGLGGTGTGGQTPDSLAQTPQGELRFIAYSSPAAAQATRTSIFLNDMYDFSTDTDTAGSPCTPYNAGGSTPRNHAARAGSQSAPGTDTTDNDFETGNGVFAFTYAIDSNPNGIGSGAACLAAAAWTAPPPGDGGPVPPPTPRLCNADGSPVYQDLLNNFAWDGCDHADDAIFPNNCHDTVGDFPVVYQCAGADLNDPLQSGTELNANPGGALETVPHPIGSDGTFDTSAVIGVGHGTGFCAPVTTPFAAAGAFGRVFGADPGGGVPSRSPQVGSGALITALTDGLMLSASPPGVGPVSYGVCNDVAETGCTNIPIEGAYTGVNAWRGHVGASLAQCQYQQGVTTRVNNGHNYNGRAVGWGGNTPNGRPCWPERLVFAAGINVWAPSSFTGPYAPDRAPATANDIEVITGTVNLLTGTLLMGTQYCTPGTPVLTNLPGACGAPIVSAGASLDWLGGYAAVFAGGGATATCGTGNVLSSPAVAFLPAGFVNVWSTPSATAVPYFTASVGNGGSCIAVSAGDPSVKGGTCQWTGAPPGPAGQPYRCYAYEAGAAPPPAGCGWTTFGVRVTLYWASSVTAKPGDPGTTIITNACLVGV